MRLFIFNLWHKKKKVRGYKTMHTFTKRIEDKTNSCINERHGRTLDIEIEQKK